jgi:hypothetical protein
LSKCDIKTSKIKRAVKPWKEKERKKYPSQWSWDSMVGVVTRLLSAQSKVQIFTRAPDLSLLQNVQTGSGAHSSPYSMGTGALSLG